MRLEGMRRPPPRFDSPERDLGLLAGAEDRGATPVPRRAGERHKTPGPESGNPLKWLQESGLPYDRRVGADRVEGNRESRRADSHRGKNQDVT